MEMPNFDNGLSDKYVLRLIAVLQILTQANKSSLAYLNLPYNVFDLTMHDVFNQRPLFKPRVITTFPKYVFILKDFCLFHS